MSLGFSTGRFACLALPIIRSAEYSRVTNEDVSPTPETGTSLQLHHHGAVEDGNEHSTPESLRMPDLHHSATREESDLENDDDDDSSSAIGPPRSLTYLNGLALVIGLQVGSGIFSAPSQVSNHVPSPGVGILVWFVAGLVVWTGAATFAELGLAMPRNGGIQEYLQYCYGDFLGFLFSWMWCVVSKPSAIAMIAMVFADHLCSVTFPADLLSIWTIRFVALIGIISITFINCLGIKSGVNVANGFLILKLLAVFSIAVIGITVAIRGTGDGVGRDQHGWFTKDSDAEPQSPWTQIGEYVTAVYGALFCYGGWETVRSNH